MSSSRAKSWARENGRSLVDAEDSEVGSVEVVADESGMVLRRKM